ncbi:J domain-containing protein [Telmatospirillum siberiense]|uniref:Molecular chaperone DnaJ n=1 Tax=Telmatospirillum siberiense TaxID=382514 RepID=A0A2N3PSS8_9PROT|nr:J domain-containing protein [Telmatospirillum siberiense]PKU23465.1 molecular chaperone DnaJ [Telmatospirillum siberiense]
MTNRVLKHSYTVPCASPFRDAVETLAERRKVNVGDLARSILLVVPGETVAAYGDPGEPPVDDRETVVLKSGPAEGRPWRRKPRLQVRMPPGHDIPFIRKALALALAMDRGDVAVTVAEGSRIEEQIEQRAAQSSKLVEINEELDRLRTIVAVLAFEPLPEGVRTRSEALHVLGFPPNSEPDSRTLRAKFRMLATIHHPDGRYGSHQRMSQLNQAMEFLRHQMA